MNKLVLKTALLFVVLGVLSFSGHSNPLNLSSFVQVSYQTVINGKSIGNENLKFLKCTSVVCKAWTNSSKKLIPGIPIESSFIDFDAKQTYQVAAFDDNKTINTPLPFAEYPALTETGETAVILGHICKHAKTSLRSNSIDIWYTNEMGVKGTPAMAYGIPDGLVLKVVRNGNFELVATEIKEIEQKDNEPLLPKNMGESLEQSEYRHRITENLITTINVFNNEQISFGNEIRNPNDSDTEKTFKYSSGTVILKKVKLPVAPEGTQLYVELYQHSNGDAYDRTGSVFMIPQDKEQSFLEGLKNGIASLPVFQARNGKSYQGVVATDRYSPLVEIMRFFTPFGIGYYNDKVKVHGQQWADSTFYKQEVTELLPVLQGERWIGVFIGNYDKGGHRVSLRLRYYPGSMEVSDEPAKKYWTMPLFNTVNVMEMSGQEYGTMFENDSLKVDFVVPEGIKNVRMRYIATGHGGWDGGDEYNQRVNTVILDGKVLFQFTPWRCDCATFRKYNPASGNFWNGITSSDGSRSGWCPGTATNPVFVPVPGLLPGKHHISVAIPIGKNEGGSFSSWNVSGVLLGEYE